MAFSEINRYMSQRCFYLCLEFYDSHICCNTHRGMLCLVNVTLYYFSATQYDKMDEAGVFIELRFLRVMTQILKHLIVVH